MEKVNSVESNLSSNSYASIVDRDDAGIRLRKAIENTSLAETANGLNVPSDNSNEFHKEKAPEIRIPHRGTVNFEQKVGNNTKRDSASSKSNKEKSEGQNAEKQRSVFNIFGFIFSELRLGYDLEIAEARYADKRRKVFAFIRMPKELEKFMFFGFLQCIEAFLYVFTFLPMRFLLALFNLAFVTCRSRRMSSSEMCDLLKMTILVASCLVLAFTVDHSAYYHMVRGQSMMKLYIFFNMLEVADKLLASFGQDILDSLMWTACEKKLRKSDHFSVFYQLVLAVAYVVLHAVLVLFQATTLNVAFNSHNKALLTIMLSNNFVELKGAVFKKFAKNNLFQMSCSDVRERFHYCVLLFVVVIRNMREYNWRLEHLWEMIPDLSMVLIGEFIVDWVKHAFITKFNEIPLEVYKDFTITIAYDVANTVEIQN